MTNPTPNKPAEPEDELDEILEDAMNDAELDEFLQSIKIPPAHMDPNTPTYQQYKQALQRQVLEGQKDVLQALLNHQDQETDLDGRPTSEPYYVISGDGERYLIETWLADLTNQLKESKE